MRPAGADAFGDRPQRYPDDDAEAVQSPPHHGSDEPPARGSRRGGLCPRGKSTCEPIRPVCLEGDWRLTRQGRDEGHARPFAPLVGPRRRSAHQTRRGQGSRTPVPAPPWRGHDSRSGDEEHRRSHGNRSVARPRVLQGDARRGESAADPRGRLRDRSRRGQANHPPRGRTAGAHRPADLCHARHGAVPPENGVDATTVYRISENDFPDALGLMRRGEVRLVINTPTNSTGARRDGYMMRRLAVDLNIPFIATVQAAEAAVQAIEEFSTGDLAVVPLQEYRRTSAKRAAKL